MIVFFSVFSVCIFQHENRKKRVLCVYFFINIWFHFCRSLMYVVSMFGLFFGSSEFSLWKYLMIFGLHEKSVLWLNLWVENGSILSGKPHITFIIFSLNFRVHKIASDVQRKEFNKKSIYDWYANENMINKYVNNEAS
jgi:hypothetical protein